MKQPTKEEWEFMKKLWNEFKAFAFKGNVVDLAVGMMIGQRVHCHRHRAGQQHSDAADLSDYRQGEL